MTHTDLVTTLAEAIRAATGKLKYPAEYQNEAERRTETTWRGVQVFEQYIPRNLFEENSYYPCAVVEWVSTTDRPNEGSLATVALSFGVFAKEEDGWKDAFNLMETVRIFLLERRTIGKKFRLADELTWQVPDQQPEPFFFVYGELTYQIYQPQEIKKPL